MRLKNAGACFRPSRIWPRDKQTTGIALLFSNKFYAHDVVEAEWPPTRGNGATNTAAPGLPGTPHAPGNAWTDDMADVADFRRTIFLVQSQGEKPDFADGKFIGLYSSLDEALAAFAKDQGHRRLLAQEVTVNTNRMLWPPSELKRV